MNEKTGLALILVGIMTGCAPAAFEPIANAPSKKSDDPTPPVTQCVPDATDYNVGINVISFEMTDDHGVNFGFNLPTKFIRSLELGVRIKSGRLDLEMGLMNPLKPGRRSVLGGSRLSDSSFNFKVGTDIVDIGSSNSARTPISKLSRLGIEDLLKKADALVNQNPNPWSTRVTKLDDANHFKIPAGAAAGIRYGDKFKIYDYKYIWTGSPCESALDRSYKVSAEPIAEAVVWAIEDDSTTLMLIGESSKPVKPGDLVEVAELFKKSKKEERTLKRAVRFLGAASQGKVHVAGAGEIDIPYYMNLQAPAVMNGSAFWVVPE